jgi:hypothetical protein
VARLGVALAEENAKGDAGVDAFVRHIEVLKRPGPCFDNREVNAASQLS